MTIQLVHRRLIGSLSPRRWLPFRVTFGSLPGSRPLNCYESATSARNVPSNGAKRGFYVPDLKHIDYIARAMYLIILFFFFFYSIFFSTPASPFLSLLVRHTQDMRTNTGTSEGGIRWENWKLIEGSSSYWSLLFFVFPTLFIVLSVFALPMPPFPRV